jgi:hypothetical protein
MKFRPGDFEEGKWYVKKGGSMVRQVVAIENGAVYYRSFDFERGRHYGEYIETKLCAIFNYGELGGKRSHYR